MAEDFTARFRVDVSDLKKGITEANKQIKLANATFRAETSGMEDWSKNADGLSSKLRSLKTVLENQKSILSSYQSQLERQQKAYEENGARVDKLKEKLRELSANGVSKADDEYKKYEAALRSAMKEQDNNGKSADDLKLKILNQQAAIGKTESSIRKYTTAEQNLGNESEEAASDIKKMDKSLDQVSGSAGRAKDKLSAIGKTLAKGLATGIATVGAAAATGVAALAKATSNAGKYADEINTLSKVTGMSSESLQAYKYAAELVDVSMETLTGSMSKNVKSMSNAANGSAKYADAYKKLGVAVTDANGELRNSEDVYWETIDALGNIQNETERDAIAMQLFGKSARDLNPLIETGSKGIADLTKEAKEMGAVMSQESLDKLNALDDAMQRLKGGAAAAKNAIGTILLPELQTLADDGVSLISSFTKEINAANGDWNKIGDAIGNLTEKFSDKILDYLPKLVEVGGKVVSGLGSAIVKAAPKLAKTATTVLATLTTNLIKSAPSVLKSGSEVIKNFITGLKSALPDILTAITESAPDIITTLVDLVSYLAENYSEFIQPIIDNMPTMIITIVNSIVDNLPRLIEGATSLVLGIVDAMPQVILGLLDALPTVIESVISGLLDCLPQLIEGAIEIVGQLLIHLPEIIGGLVKAAPRIIGSIASSLVSAAPKLWNAFTGIFSKAWEKVKEVFANVGEWFSNTFSGAWDGIKEAWGKVKEFFQGIWDGITGVFKGVGNWFKGVFEKAVSGIKTAWSGIKTWFKNLWDGIWSVIKTPINWIIKGMNTIIDGINSIAIDVPDWIPGIGGQHWGFDIPKIPELAYGGVLKKGQVGLLEGSGAEAVVPLERNTGWITKVANELARQITVPQLVETGYVTNNNKSVNFTQNIYTPKAPSRIELYRQSRNLLSLYGGNM